MTWQDISTAPVSGEPFLAALTNGWVVILWGRTDFEEHVRFAWWGSDRLSIPYEPSHPPDTDWSATHTLRATHWQPLPSPPEGR